MSSKDANRSQAEAIEKIESKLASGEIAPDYHVRQAIVNRYAENHGGLQLVGGVLVAVVGFSLVGWAGGVGIGLIAAQHLMNWHKKRSEDWRAIDSGRYGHLLTAAEAKHYERVYGKGSLQAAKQGDYSHAGIESEEAIDVPAEAVEDTAKKSEATATEEASSAVATNEAASVDATSADATIHRPAAAPSLFDWSRIADADECPKFALIGKMNAGKSRLVKYLVKHVIFPGQQVDAVLFDVFGRDWEWEGFTTLQQCQAMAEQMAADLEEVDRRLQAYQQGESNFTPMFRLLEEAVSTIPEIRALGSEQSTTLTRWQSKHGSLTRKLRSRACYVSTELTAESLGMSGDARNDLTIIFPGQKGISKALNDTRMLKLGTRDNARLKETLMEQLKGIDRPALVWHDGEWYAASIPTLDAKGNPEGHPDYDPNFEYLPPGSDSVQGLNQNGSDSVQGGSSLNQNGSDLNPGSNPVQWLNRCLDASSETLNQNGSGFSSDGSGGSEGGSGTFTSENLTSVQAVQRITELQSAGLNQTQIIFVLWRVKKGGSQAYQDAVNEYKLLMNEGN